MKRLETVVVTTSGSPSWLTSSAPVDRVKPADLQCPPTNTTIPETDVPDTPRTSKSVVFVPLSPKSSATLRRHHEEQEAKSEISENNGNKNSSRRRRNSDPSSDRSLTSGHRAHDKDASSDLETDDEEAIEMLPDRFDAEGRPLDGSSPVRGRGPAWHSRRGDFEYRSPRGANGVNMRGEWGVSGTDAEVVERIVRNVTGVLEGRGSWLGLVSGILSGNLLNGGEEDDKDGTREKRERPSHRERGRIHDRERERDRSRDGRSESRHRRRKTHHDDEHDYDDDHDDHDKDSRRYLWRDEDEDRRRGERRKYRGWMAVDEPGESSRHAEGGRRARDRERRVSDHSDDYYYYNNYNDDRDGYYDDDYYYHEDRKRRRRRKKGREEDDFYERGVGRSQTWGI